MEPGDPQELLLSLQRNVDSKVATIKHLESALDAKSMTIGILLKAHQQGGDLETHIASAIQAKVQAAMKAKDEEIERLTSAKPDVEALRGQWEQERLELQRTAAAERQRLEAEVAALRGRWEQEQLALQRATAAERQQLEDATAERQRLEAELAARGAELEGAQRFAADALEHWGQVQRKLEAQRARRKEAEAELRRVSGDVEVLRKQWEEETQKLQQAAAAEHQRIQASQKEALHCALLRADGERELRRQAEAEVQRLALSGFGALRGLRAQLGRLASFCRPTSIPRALTDPRCSKLR